MVAATRQVNLQINASEFKAQADRVNKSLASVSTSAKKAVKDLSSMEKTMRLIGNVGRGVFLVRTIETFGRFTLETAKAAEEVGLLSKKMLSLTKDTTALDKVIRAANKVGVSFTELGGVVGRFAVATKNAYDVDNMIKWTEGVIKSGRLVGATQKEINSGLTQLSQGLSAGALMGDEFRSVMENLPLLAVEIGKEFKGSGKALKELSSQGLITGDVVVRAMERLQVSMEDIPGLTDTIDAELAKLSNSWKEMLAEMSKSTGGFVKESIKYFTFLAEANRGVFKMMNEAFAESSKNNAFSSQADLAKDLLSTVAELNKVKAKIREGGMTGLFSSMDLQKAEEDVAKATRALTENTVVIDKYNKSKEEAIKLEEQTAALKEDTRLTKIYDANVKALALADKINLSSDKGLKISAKHEALREALLESMMDEQLSSETLVALNEAYTNTIIAENVQLAAYRDELRKQKQAIKDLAEEYKDWDTKTDKYFENLAKHFAAQEQATKDEEEALQSLIYKFDPLLQKQDEYKENLVAINQLYKDGDLTGTAAIAAIKAEWEKLHPEIKKVKTEFEKMWDEIGEGFEKNLGSLFADVLKGSENAFENFVDRILDMWIDMIAQVAAKELMMSFGANVSGGTTTGGTTTGGLSSLFTPNSLASVGEKIWDGFVGSSAATTTTQTALEASSMSGGSFQGFTGYLQEGAVEGTFASATSQGYSGISGVSTLTEGVSKGLSDFYSSSTAGNMAFGGASLAGGYVAGQVGGWGGVAAGTATTVGLTAATGALGIGTAGATGMAGASTALAAVPVVGWIAAAAAILYASGVFGGEEAKTKISSSFNGSGTNVDSFKEQSGQAGTVTAFGDIAFGIQHTGNEGQMSDEEAAQYAAQLQQRLDLISMIDEQIVYTMDLGTDKVNAIKEALQYTRFEDDLGGDTALTSRYGIIADEIGGEFNTVFDSLNGGIESILATTISYTSSTDEMKAVYDELILSEDGAAESILMLGTNLNNANLVLNALGATTYDLSVNGANAATSLINAAGGIENLNALATNFFNAYETEAEKATRLSEDYAYSVLALNAKYGTNLSMLSGDHEDVTRAMGDNIEGNEELYVSLVALTPAAIAAANAIAAAADAMNKAQLDSIGRMAEYDKAAAAAATANYGLNQIAGGNKWLTDNGYDYQIDTSSPDSIQNSLNEINTYLVNNVVDNETVVSEFLNSTQSILDNYIDLTTPDNTTSTLTNNDTDFSGGSSAALADVIDPLIAAALSLTQAFRTAEEIYDDRIAEIESLVPYGISDGTYDRAIQDAMDTFNATITNDLGQTIDTLISEFKSFIYGVKSLRQSIADDITRISGGAPNFQGKIDAARTGLTGTADDVAIYDEIRGLIVERYDYEAGLIEENKSKLDEQYSTLENNIDLFDSAFESILDFLDSLNLSELSTLSLSQRTNYAKGVYGTDLLKSQAGDTDALQNISTSAQDYLTEALASSKTAEEYNKILSNVRTSMTMLVDGKADYSRFEREKIILDEEAAKYDEQLANLQAETVTLLGGLDAEILTLQKTLTSDFTIQTATLVTQMMGDTAQIVAAINSSLSSVPAPDVASIASIIQNGGNVFTGLDGGTYAQDVANTPSTVDANGHILSGVRGSPVYELPSYDIGSDYVPYDMTANIHRGERILPAAENARLSEEIKDLKDVVQALTTTLVKNSNKTTKITQKWDAEGLPDVRAA